MFLILHGFSLMQNINPFYQLFKKVVETLIFLYKVLSPSY